MKEGRGRLILQWLIPYVASIVVILILVFSFSNKINQDAAETVEKELIWATENYAAEFKGDLDSVRIAGETTADVIAQLKFTDSATIKQLLSMLTEKEQIKEAVYCNARLEAMDHTGRHIELEEVSYAGLLANSTGLKYYYQTDDVLTGDSVILLSIPVGEKSGTLLLYYPMERFSQMIHPDEEFDETAFFTIIKANGDIFKTGNEESNFLKGKNIWSSVDEEYLNSATGVTYKIRNQQTGCVGLAAGGEERTLSYVPLGIEDWALAAGISQSYVDKHQTSVSTRTIPMLYEMLGVMILFMVIFVVVNYMGKIRNAEKSKNLEEKADTDLLTGLNNKLATERKIKEYMRENPDSMGMMFLLDIDNFKKINDTMGHAFGDEVLSSLGKNIGTDFRVTDIMGRTGGDEFTIFLKDLQNNENVLKEAQKLENFFKHFQVGEYTKYSATASIGAAIFPADGKDFETLYKSADQALYKAKRRGKNQLAFYDESIKK